MNTYTEHHAISYHSDAPAWLDEFCAVPEMQRLRGVGMNCGCEYTAFPRFLGLPRYSRFRHSVGVCLITWHFTGEIEQALAALFHDISTPSFAHTVDFLHGDYLRQEYTEGRTAAMITQSPEIMALLGKYGVAPDAVTDYHLYPIADNDSTRLSADRLEYTLGNLAGYSLCSPAALQEYYDALCVASAPDGAPELAFQRADIAAAFARDALKMSRIYVSDEDRYAMQRLAELLRHAVEKGVLSLDDLYGTEDDVIAKITSDDRLRAEWAAYRSLHQMLLHSEAASDAAWRVIPAKKRCIDPLVAGKGRLSELDADFAAELSAFLLQPLDEPMCAI